MNDLAGIVLAGGASSRMQSDKALLVYYNKPQYLHVSDLLQSYTKQVLISCKKQQNLEGNCLYDLEEFDQVGPAAAWLSAFSTLKQGFVIMGIDYPLFDANELQHLMISRDPNADASVMFNETTGYFEPMLGIYELSFFNHLKAHLNAPNISIQNILRQCTVKQVNPLNPQAIISVDDPEHFKQIKQTIHDN